MKRTAAADAAATGPGDGKSFEAMMERLEALVDKLEGGNLTLEESIRSFEEGMGLVKNCSTVLQEADLRIQKLTADAEKGAAPGEGGGGRGTRSDDDVDGELPF
jgi:exodeoxyribonuclease VII small subunit